MRRLAEFDICHKHQPSRIVGLALYIYDIVQYIHQKSSEKLQNTIDLLTLR